MAECEGKGVHSSGSATLPIRRWQRNDTDGLSSNRAAVRKV